MDWCVSGWGQCDCLINIWFHKRGGNVLNIRENKLYLCSAVDYSVDKYIYRSCMSGPSNITLL